MVKDTTDLEIRFTEALDRIADAVERQAVALEGLGVSLAPLVLAANLVPNQRDRILERMYAVVMMNAGKSATLAGAEELTEELVTFLRNAVRDRNPNGGG